MRFTTLISAALALVSTASAVNNSYVQYTVTCPTTYIVKNGDTCSIIGKAFNIYTSKIKEWNPSINSRCTNLYIDQILCLSAPTIHSSVVQVGTLGTLAPTQTRTTTTATQTTTVLTMPSAGPECAKDSDCDGTRCCDLSSFTCVLDPYGTICDRKTTVTLTESSAITKAAVTSTAASTKPTTVSTAQTASATTVTNTHKLFARACVSGSKGKGNGDGYKGYCCSDQSDCWDDCISGVCNGPSAPSSTTKKTTTTKTTTTKKATTTAGTPSSCTAGSYGLGNGDGYNGACCADQSDCWDDCISGVCNGPSATKTTTTKKTTTTTKKTTTTTAVGSYPTGLTVQISSSADFCLFLPPSPGNALNNGGKQDTDAIADSEKNAVAFCTRPNMNAPGAGVLPEGFIVSASYQTNSTAGFKQVRGTIDRDAYDLSSKDDGGQYDNHGSGSPPGSVCAGYPYYVSLIEPSTNDFCIRCCETYSDCNAGRSAYGCNRVVPAL